MNQELLKSLRAKFRPQEGTTAHDHSDYVHEFGDVVTSLLYSHIFVPKFIEVEGSVLLATGREDQEASFREARKKSAMNLSELEASYNWVEVPYLFADPVSTDGEAGMLAQVIAEAWRAHLKLAFPRRQFAVSVLTPEETGSVVGVGFVEVR